MSPLQAFGLRVLAALALASALPVAAGAQTQSPPNREFTLQNETDQTLRELYVSPPGAADRGNDRLGPNLVAPSTTHRVRLGRTRDCVFDVTAIFQDGSEEQRQRVDICRAPRVVFGDPAMPTLQVAIANRSQIVLRELYASAQGPAAWGPDRLETSVIEPGGSFAMRLRTRDCVFDLRAVYADEREEVKQRVNLCTSRNVAFDRSGVPRLPLRSVLLLNRHLATVQEVYMSPSTDSDWGPDRLGAATLPAGRQATAEMEGGCQADIRIVFPNGGAEERREVDICALSRIVLRPGWTVVDRLDEEGTDSPGTGAVIASGVLRLRNAGRLPIVEVYTALPGSERGEDRLGEDILPVGEVAEIAPPDGDACTADLTVVFRDGREVARPGIDLCAGEEIEIR